VLIVRVNGRDHRVQGLPELDEWRREGRVTDATPVYDPDADGWRTVGDLLGVVPTPPPTKANVATATSEDGAVGDFLAKAAARPKRERLKYSVFNPPWVRCPNCGYEGKAQLKGWGLTTWGVIKVILAVTLGPTIAFVARFAEPEWGGLVGWGAVRFGKDSNYPECQGGARYGAVRSGQVRRGTVRCGQVRHG